MTSAEFRAFAQRMLNGNGGLDAVFLSDNRDDQFAVLLTMEEYERLVEGQVRGTKRWPRARYLDRYSTDTAR